MTDVQLAFIYGVILWPVLWFLIKLPGFLQKLLGRRIESWELVTKEDMKF